MSEVFGLSAAQAVERVRAGDLSPRELWDAYRERAAAEDLNAFLWLADEAPDERAREWCREHGVRISTRHGITGYHRPSWPRRTRCKEGNLAFFYDMWGYRLYDVVAQLDADHVPAPDYLQKMVIPFTDSMVGYVAAPSICDRNAARSWAARGRLYAEATLHGPMQAGHSAGSRRAASARTTPSARRRSAR